MKTVGLRAKHFPYPVRLRRGNFDYYAEANRKIMPDQIIIVHYQFQPLALVTILG